MIKNIIACWTFALAAFWFFSFVCFFWTLGFCQISKNSSELSGKVLHGMKVFFVSASIFLNVIEKFLFKKIQRHEKQKTLTEIQLNSICNMISKALTDNEISEVEFEKIISQIGKRNETYIKFEEVDLEIDKQMPKMLPGRKSESFV